jgi:hypothetical protein
MRSFVDSWGLAAMSVVFLVLCLWPFRPGARERHGKPPTRSSRMITMANNHDEGGADHGGRLDEATGVHTVGHEWDGIEELTIRCRAGG